MSDHTVINNVDGIYVCGRNEKGQLGLGDNNKRNILTKLPSFCEEIIGVYLGYNHTIFQTNVGLYVCGINYYGQLGLGDNRDRNVPTKLNFDYEIISIYCGGSHTIFRTSNGVYVCGSNTCGQLGLGDNNHRNRPTKLDFDHEIISIYCGGHHTIFHTTDSQGSNGVYVCGANGNGQLGLGDNNNRNILTKLDFDHEIISIRCGYYHTIFHATDSQGSNGVYCCGYNVFGQLGLDDNINRNIPTKLNFDYEIISISCGHCHTIFHTTNGVYVCGNNGYGQLGLDNNIDRNGPTKLNFFDHDENAEIIFIHCGIWHTIFHTTNGVYSCGYNGFGQLGLDDNINRNLPTKVDFDHETIIITGRLKRFKTTKAADPNL